MILLGVFRAKTAIAVIAFLGVVGADPSTRCGCSSGRCTTGCGPRVGSREIRSAQRRSRWCRWSLMILVLAFYPQFKLHRSQAVERSARRTRLSRRAPIARDRRRIGRLPNGVRLLCGAVEGGPPMKLRRHTSSPGGPRTATLHDLVRRTSPGPRTCRRSSCWAAARWSCCWSACCVSERGGAPAESSRLLSLDHIAAALDRHRGSCALPPSRPRSSPGASVRIDHLALLIDLICAVAAIAAVLMSRRAVAPREAGQGEYHSLLLMFSSARGWPFLVSSQDMHHAVSGARDAARSLLYILVRLRAPARGSLESGAQVLW